jgi:hypothetical protein
MASDISHMLKAIPCPGKSRSCRPQSASYRRRLAGRQDVHFRVGHGACEISALARLRNRSASGQAAAKARRTRLAVSMTRILYRSASSMILRVNAKAPRIRAWRGARESSERVPHIRSLCERSRILSLVKEPVRHQAVERSAPLGLDPLEWKGRQSLLQPLPHNGHDALQAPLRPVG